MLNPLNVAQPVSVSSTPRTAQPNKEQNSENFDSVLTEKNTEVSVEQEKAAAIAAAAMNPNYQAPTQKAKNVTSQLNPNHPLSAESLAKQGVNTSGQANAGQIAAASSGPMNRNAGTQVQAGVLDKNLVQNKNPQIESRIPALQKSAQKLDENLATAQQMSAQQILVQNLQQQNVAVNGIDPKRLQASQQAQTSRALNGIHPNQQAAHQMMQLKSAQMPGVSGAEISSALSPASAQEILMPSDFNGTAEVLSSSNGLGSAKELSTGAQQASSAGPTTTAVQHQSTENFLATRQILNSNSQQVPTAAMQAAVPTAMAVNGGFNSRLEGEYPNASLEPTLKKNPPNLSLIHNEVRFNTTGQPMLMMDAPVSKGAGPKTTLSHDSVQQLGYAIGGLTKNTKDGGEVRLMLKPNNLGEVKIDVRTEGGKVSLKIETQDENSKRLIESSLRTLEDGLKNNHQLSLSRVEVFNQAPASTQILQNMNGQMNYSESSADSGGQKYLDRQFAQDSSEQGRRSAREFLDEGTQNWNNRRRSSDSRLDMIA